jgi:dihydroorotate dehydrogenase (NAD+) catalytic subunit
MPKIDLYFEKPVMNAAGMLGFSPDPKGRIDLSGFGAFVTSPISLEARKPAHGKRFLSFPGGFLLHTGYPNPGLSGAIHKHANRWAHSQVPIIVSLLAQDVDALARMVPRLEGLEGIMGVEVSLPTDIDPGMAHEMTFAVLGELPVIIRLPFEEVLPNADVLDAITDAGASAVSIAPPRGSLPDEKGGTVTGRLYGPGLLPQALSRLKILMKTGIPVIGSGGIYTKKDVETILEIGALAVQLDSVLWRGDPLA